MNTIAKIIIALVIGAAAWGISITLPSVPAIVLFLVATVITAVVTSISRNGAITRAPTKAGETPVAQAQTASTGPREEGEVKWFNVSKGFGFITKDNGDEIFVHFRSIRGEGRRGLRDGQRVSFVEAQSDKGPQAEDVDGL